jgi:hypothetical protein
MLHTSPAQWRRDPKYFITCDDEIVRKGKEIERRYGLKVVNPVEFIDIEEEEW